MRVGLVEALGNGLGATVHFQATGQHAVGAHAAINAFEHHHFHSRNEFARRRFAVQGNFIFHEHFMQRLVGVLAERQQVSHRFEVIGHCFFHAPRTAHKRFIGINDESTTD